MSQPVSARPGASAAATLAVLAALVVIGAIVLFILFSQTDGPTLAPSPSPSAPGVSPTAAATEASLNEQLLSQRLTVLVIGIDVNAAREARDEPVNTDTVMLASVSADQSEVVLVSLPRDTVDIPLPDGGTWDEKVNAILRERDLETLVGAMETLFGVPIDGHVLLDMDDFAALVDGIGGVEVTVEEPMVDPPIDLALEPGTHQLDGETALKYVRTRVDGDYARAARQQEVLVEVVAGIADGDTDLDLAQLLDGLDSLETDLPLEDLPTLVEIARRAQSAAVTREVIQPPELITFEGDRGDGRGFVLVPDVDAIRAFVQGLIGE